MPEYILGGKKYTGSNLKVRAGTVCVENINGISGSDTCIPLINLSKDEKKRYGIE